MTSPGTSFFASSSARAWEMAFSGYLCPPVSTMAKPRLLRTSRRISATLRRVTGTGTDRISANDGGNPISLMFRSASQLMTERPA